MTSAPPLLLEARRLLLDHLPIEPNALGIVGDVAHIRSGDSYHLGLPEQTQDGYSVRESPRDRAGLSGYASALDIGWFSVTVTGRRWTLRDFNRWLVDLCVHGDPDTRDIREIIYSLDGVTVRRWDRLGKRSTGSLSHTTHTHISEFRDARGRRMVALMRRFLTHIGLIAPPAATPPTPIQEEDEMRPYTMIVDTDGDPTEPDGAVYACYPSGRVRWIGLAEFGALRAQGVVPVPSTDRGEIDRLAAAARLSTATAAMVDTQALAAALAPLLQPGVTEEQVRQVVDGQLDQAFRAAADAD